MNDEISTYACSLRTFRRLCVSDCSCRACSSVLAGIIPFREGDLIEGASVVLWCTWDKLNNLRAYTNSFPRNICKMIIGGS